MSVPAVKWAIGQKVGDATAKFVLVNLAWHHNAESGLCCPSIPTIQDECDFKSSRTVQQAIKRLADQGLLLLQREYKNGTINRTLYTLVGMESAAAEGLGGVFDAGGALNAGGAPTAGDAQEAPTPCTKCTTPPALNAPTPLHEMHPKEKVEREEKETTNICQNHDDIPAPSLEDYGIDAVTDFQLEPPDVTEDTDAPAALPGFEDEVIDKVPVQAFVDIYNAVLGEALGKVQKITGARRQRIRARYRDIYRECKCANDKEGLYMTREFFEKVNRSNFLMGRATKWRASFDWITKAENYTKISEGNYDNGRR